MIVTIVQFDLPEPVSLEDARARFGENASRYLDRPGLLFKAYLRSEDGTQAGGAYWWADRASAEACFNPDWEAGVTAKYGSPPSIQYFDAPVVVDALRQAIRVDAPEI